MQIAVIGAGNMGCVYGGNLARIVCYTWAVSWRLNGDH